MPKSRKYQIKKSPSLDTRTQNPGNPPTMKQTSLHSRTISPQKAHILLELVRSWARPSLWKQPSYSPEKCLILSTQREKAKTKRILSHKANLYRANSIQNSVIYITLTMQGKLWSKVSPRSTNFCRETSNRWNTVEIIIVSLKSRRGAEASPTVFPILREMIQAKNQYSESPINLKRIKACPKYDTNSLAIRKASRNWSP